MSIMYEKVSALQLFVRFRDIGINTFLKVGSL